MRLHIPFAFTLAAATLFSISASADAKALMVAPPRPGQAAAQADIVVTGKITEIEKDTVEASQFPGAPKDQKATYKIAVLKIDTPIIGGKGLTQFRVGFPELAAATPRPLPPGGGARPPIRVGGRGPVALTADQEGCFFLTRHHEGDFYVLAGFGPPLDKKDENYTKQLEEVKKVAKIIENPVTALKAKELDDRFNAANVLLQRYQLAGSNKPMSREAIPAEENKLILAILTELPWVPTDVKPRGPTDPVPPSRSQLWYMVQQDMTGFKQPVFPPQRPGDPPVDGNKIMDEATSKFLKANADKVKLKGFNK